MIRTIPSAVFALLAFVIGYQPALAEDAVQPGDVEQPAYVPGRILVKFRPEASEDRVHGLLAAVEARSERVLEDIDVHILSLPPEADETAYVNAFRGLAEVEFAELDRVLAPSAINPNDPYYAVNWHFFKISAPSAWSVTTGSSNLVIAFVDTGIDGTHQDLALKLVGGWNVVDNNTNTSDVINHGTEAAGTATEIANNGLGSAGICWGCLIMPVRVTNDSYGRATSSNVAAGITWAANHGAKIAAVGYDLTNDATVTSAAQYLWSKGGIAIMPSGNLGTVGTAPDNTYVLTVGATDNNDIPYSWSNTGNNVDLVAPGCVIYTAAPINSYATQCGTSASMAIVAGVAGLVWSVNPVLTPAQMTDIVKRSVDDLGTVGWDTIFGWGRINALKAVNNASGGTKTNTTTTLTSSLNPSTFGQSVTFTATVSPSTATGTVTFRDGTTTLGSGTLSSGRATFSTSTLTAGTHSITASYGGNSNYNGSTSPALTQTVNTSTKTNTTTTLTSSLNPSTFGQSVTFTATVSPSTATGTVTFRDGTTTLGSGTLSSGRATFSTSTLTAGTHSITASYGGNSSFNGSTSGTLTQTVNSTGDFSIAASPAKANVKAGNTAQFTVNVTGSGGFNSTVSFSMASSPPGLTASFSPSTITGSGSTIMSVLTAGAAKGRSYTLTITGTGGGRVHSTTVNLNVR